MYSGGNVPQSLIICTDGKSHVPKRRKSKQKERREVMVVPIKEDTFAAAKKIHVYAVPIIRSSSDVSYIAFYRGAPTQAITHYAKVEKIEKNQKFSQVFPTGSTVVTRDDQLLKVYRLDRLVELKRRVKKGWSPPVSGPRYTDLATLRKARYLDEVWPLEKGKEPPEEAPKGRPEQEPKAEAPMEDKRTETQKRRDRRKRKKQEAKAAAEAAKKEEPPPKEKRRKRGRKRKAAEEADDRGEKAGAPRPSVHYIVDGSNVAMEARTFKEGGRLRQIELVLEKLSQTKGAATTVLVDANLRHHIDRKDDLERMIKDRRVLQAPAQTDADEFILQTAEAHRSRGERVVIITNDRYLDYIKKYKPRFDWVKDATKQFMFVFSADGSKALEAMISLA